MEKGEQTQEIKLRLYALTKSFVYKYQPYYYRQFTGDIDDLVHEFYSQFLTEKSREPGKEQSLLDKYDPSRRPASFTEELYFANLVMKCAIRMLIDRSRSDKRKKVSYESAVEEYGDLILEAWGLTTENDQEITIDNLEISKDFVDALTRRINNMSEEKRLSLTKSYHEMRCVVKKPLQVVLDRLLPLPQKPEIPHLLLHIEGRDEDLFCPQLTAKTVRIIIDGVLTDFDRETGICRNKNNSYKVTIESINSLKGLREFKIKF